ncbi:nucleoside-diphosphate sugar epimerase [Acidovorax sp.]|uniref:nucleoside-diphosphate sugar epimerase n=1 Tax=Acidovorax sp. TaxID=1872122 RepID=UPI00260CAC53|nr:nucleoside-diphosphate sugar epimerase [Acidovorax sp.]
MLHARDRRAPALSQPRLQLHGVDFADLPALPPVDDVYITLGTTIAAAGSQSAFRAVDYDAVLATARAARAAGATRCGVVTAMGANAQSRIFYNRIKGEVERDLQSLGFATLVIARPSLMIGERQALQQAARPAESLSIQLFKWLDPLIPANYRARPGTDVGHALVHAVQSGPAGLHVLSGRALQPR